jgi:hypothetical protein
MQFLQTQLATDFDESGGLTERLIGPIDTASPSYCGKHHRIRTWLIEFDEDGNPWREIGLDAEGGIVVAGPSAKDYGFWLDTNMKFEDFTGTLVTQDQFESLWTASGVTCP